ncbi:probable multidrug resistance-associated protein lethal(2)03659 [Anthonomus grandis grandis]|uniref:probable multidrug resistance-associated protein lethal(2)03659 n=1 Tax=Anthonomus grandis grandis TaxID=2921223 RepID=UPI0021650299|nr:probable multidrug resistance-associated protein lethal(2)03659 [Anthonomus grandis grandis]
MYSGYEQVRRKNPRQTSNLFSFLTFGYTISLFRKGFRGNLQESDIYEVPKFCSSKRCGDKISSDWTYCSTVLKLLLRSFGRKYFLYSTIHLTWHLLSSTIHPYAISHFISYFQTNQTKISRSDAYYYGGIVIFLSVFRNLWIFNYFMLECTLGIQIRASLSSLIYRKVISLRPEQTRGSMGSVVTVLTKDIRTIQTAMWPLSDLYVGIIKLIFLTYLLYVKIGPISIIPIGFILVIIIFQAILSSIVLKLRLQVGKLTDMRLHFTREILTILKIIKMYTWETFFHKRLCEARKKETKANLKTWYLGSFIIAFGTLIGKLLFPLFLLMYLSLDYSINTELLYYLMSLFQEYSGIIGSYISAGLALTAEFYASVVRIGRVLDIQEKSSNLLVERYVAVDQENHMNQETPKIELDNISVSFSEERILDCLTISINSPGLYILTGPLGCGKSSVLKVILGEYRVNSGTANIIGDISYASQDPWIFPATIRQNILFGQKFDSDRYEEVLEVCCLQHDIKLLPNGDNSIIIDGGMNLSKGQQARINLARAIYKSSDIYLLDDPLTCLDVKVQSEIFLKCFRRFLKRKIVILVTQNSKHFKYASEVIVMKRGGIKLVSKSDDVDHIESVTPFEEDIKDENLVNFDIMPHTNIYHEDKQIGSVESKNYYKYIKYGGGIFTFIILLAVFFGAQLAESSADKLLSKWVDYQQVLLNTTFSNKSTITQTEELSFQRDNTFDLYIILIIVSTIIDLLKSYGFLLYCRRASIKLHKLMSSSVIHCLMTFLDSHFIGNILNRFSYDLDQVDEVFPFHFQDVIIAAFAVAGTLILLVSVNVIFLAISLLFFTTLGLLRMFYIPTARALKRLEAITRSPYIGHLNATVEGLSTIRAFKAQDLLKDEFDKHQDLAISVGYMETTTALAFGYALNLTCSVFISIVVLTFLFINPETTVGNVGLALTQIITMSSNLQWIIRAWALIEQCMTSVERVVEYTDIAQEEKSRQGNRSKWPINGQIIYKDMNLLYGDGNKVLKGISFTIKAGEKVGIVGRTGAGKSSIVSTLLRLYDYQGTIYIDTYDISKMPLSLLRSKISVIPQDPIIFAGTVRQNIDPFETHLDKDLWRVIKNVQLEYIIVNLDENIYDLKLSIGQKQLLCLARALLRNNKIVVMDEPTANLDNETDRLVHNLISKYFSECTLIMIAHRLHSALGCNKVIVMENGEIAEFDEPKKLMENKESLFHNMMKIID